MIKVKSVAHMQQLIKKAGGMGDFFIAMGISRSSKDISWNGKTFWVLNNIDGTDQHLTPKQIMNKRYTNIGDAITQGAFYHRP